MKRDRKENKLPRRIHNNQENVYETIKVYELKDARIVKRYKEEVTEQAESIRVSKETTTDRKWQLFKELLTNAARRYAVH